MGAPITVVGAGPVGTALARGMRDVGRAVRIAVRDPEQEKYDGLRSEHQLCAIGSDLGSAGLVVLAVPAAAVGETVGRLGLRSGHVVVDATNAVGSPVPDGFESMGAFVRSLVPDRVDVVKAFNTIGAEHLSNGRLGDGSAFLPIAGDDGGRDVVAGLAAEMVTMVEDHARLWIHLAIRCGWGRRFGFSIARSQEA